MAITQMQDQLFRKMSTAMTHAFFISMIPLQIMRTMWPISLNAPLPKDRAGTSANPRPEHARAVAR